MICTELAPASVASSIDPNIQIRIASTRKERWAAFRLIHESYLRCGLCPPHPLGIRITPHQLEPTADILIAEHDGEVICTMTLVRDGERGLPMDDLYPHELDCRRLNGRQLAEITCLADQRQHPSRFLSLFVDMGRLLVQFAHRMGVDELVASMNPRHAPLYRRCMAFQQMGDRQKYAAVCDNPAIGMALDLTEARYKSPAAWARFFASPIPDDALQASPISDGDREYFQRQLRVRLRRLA